jgi:hypothetical protein
MIDFNQLFKYVVVIAALFALLFVAIKLSDLSVKQRGTEQNQNQTNLPVDIKPLSKDVLPSAFPTDIPLEEGVEIKENSDSVRREDGVKQATRSFISSKTAEQNSTIYVNYLRNNDWEILNQATTEDFRMILGKKGYQLFQVTITPNSDGKTTTVLLTLTEQQN